MKKILALALALMMVLSMFTMGITVSAAGDKPAGAIAISTADQLASMEAGKYYYLTADITLGKPNVYATQATVGTMATVATKGTEAARITIPAGATLDGNGYTIYQGFYNQNPGWYENNNKYTHSAKWTHEMFAFAAGDKITMKDLKFGSKDLPVYLSSGAATAETAAGIASNIYTANDGYSMFRDVPGANVEWNNVNFFVERYGRELGSYNFGVVFQSVFGTHVFESCTMNVSIFSAGSQTGLWVQNYNDSRLSDGTRPVNLTFRNCVNKPFYIYNTIDNSSTIGGEVWGSVTSGFVYFAYNSTVMENCINNLNITANYGGTGYQFGAFIADVRSGSAKVQACVNNGDFSINKISIGGGIVGRTQSGSTENFQIINCINNGDINRSNADAMTSNHGFGGITGHTGSTALYEVSGCVNNGNIINGVGNVGGIVGFVENVAPTLTIKNCTNNGDISSKGAADVGGIVGQARNNTTITNCKNFGDIDAPSTVAGGIVGKAASWTNPEKVAVPVALILNNCINYGTIGSNSQVRAGGILGQNNSTDGTYTFNNCVNYGKVLTCQYSGGFIAEINAAGTLNFTGCQNYGEIAGVHGVGGFVGQTADSANIAVTITGSLNAGNVHEGPAAGEGIGGFFGRIAGTKPTITISTSANTGTITGSSKVNTTYGFFGDTFGQFIGLYTVSALSWNYSDPVIGGFHDWSATGAKAPKLDYCFAYGAAVPAEGAVSLTGWETGVKGGDGKVTAIADSKYVNRGIAVEVAPNNGFYGINVQVDKNSYVETIEDTLTYDDPTNILKEIFNLDFIAGDTELGEHAYANAIPMVRGYQMSTDGASIRIAATINSSTYDRVGFKYSVNFDGADIVVDEIYTAKNIWSGLNAVGADGTIEEVAAADMGGKYLTAIVFNNVPEIGKLILTVTPMGTTTDGTVYEGTTYTVTITHGVVTSVE